MKNRPLVLAALLVGAVASIAESYDQFQTVRTSETEAQVDVLEEDDALTYVLEAATSGESDGATADLHAALVIHEAELSNPGEQPLELIATITPADVILSEATTTVRIPLITGGDAPSDEAPGGGFDAADDYGGPYVHRVDSALEVLNITGFPHACADSFNCDYRFVVKFTTSRPLAEGETLDLNWQAVAAADYWRWDGEYTDAELELSHELFGADA